MSKFEEFGLSRELLDSIARMEITEPTEIQSKSIPHIMAGKDVIGESATGSGKTLAFGCAIVDRVVPREGLQALVLTPTRELAEQVKESLRTMSSNKKIRVVTVYGGVNITPQIEHIPKADVVVATPGRLLDHLERRTIDLSHVKILVLDEADRMFEMGFIDDVERIIRHCPKERQTLCFSATIAENLKGLVNRHMANPVKVAARNQVDPSKLKQVYYDVQRSMKLSLLAHLLENENSKLVLVFCNTRRTVDFVAKNLRANKINAIAFHGGLTQNKRSRTLESFSGSSLGVLVCTDVAARGLHIENISHVYNYEIPKDSKEYVHRIGRTARAGEEGKAINILCDIDYDNFSRIVNDYKNFKIEKAEKPYIKMLETVRVDDARGRFGPRRSYPQRNDSRGRYTTEGRTGNYSRGDKYSHSDGGRGHHRSAYDGSGNSGGQRFRGRR